MKRTQKIRFIHINLMTKTQYVEWDLNYGKVQTKYHSRAATAGKAPQGLGLAWILQNIKQQHTADVDTTVAALPTKNWP